jgi:uncharacterized cupin superfamily protein
MVSYKKKYEEAERRIVRLEQQIPKDKKFRVIVGTQEFTHSMEGSAETAKAWIRAGITEITTLKKGDNFIIKKDFRSSFELDNIESFKKKVIELIDADVWFFTTERL